MTPPSPAAPESEAVPDLALSDALHRAASLRALNKRVAALAEQARDEAEQAVERAWEATGEKRYPLTLPDGTAFGTVTRSHPEPKVTPIISDVEAFTAWVAEKHPGEIVNRVREDFCRQLLKSIGANSEAVPGVELQERTRKPGIYIKTRPDIDSSVVDAWSGGDIESLLSSTADESDWVTTQAPTTESDDESPVREWRTAAPSTTDAGASLASSSGTSSAEPAPAPTAHQPSPSVLASEGQL